MSISNLTVESLILSQVMRNESYARKTLPFIKEDYFLDETDRVVYKAIRSYIDKYNTIPSKGSLISSLSDDRSLG